MGPEKTINIRVLIGQICPSSGQATVAGWDVVKGQQRLKERIGAVFEKQNLYELPPAADVLHFDCCVNNLPVSRIQEVVDLVHLTEHFKELVRPFTEGWNSAWWSRLLCCIILPIMYGRTVFFLAFSSWTLRRQSSVLHIIWEKPDLAAVLAKNREKYTGAFTRSQA